MIGTSKAVAAAAITLALTETLEDEKRIIHANRAENIMCAGVNYGGEFNSSISKIIERAIVAAKREGVISETHKEEGAVAGAAHEAIMSMMGKALGLNVGGKIAIARCDEHITVAIYFGVGLLHLNEIAIGLGHRAI